MSAPVDHELIRHYVQGDLADAERAEVRRRVASDPAWQRALDEALELEMAMYAVADELAAAAVAPAPAPAPWWRRWWVPTLAATLAAAAVAALVVGGSPAVPYAAELRLVPFPDGVCATAPAGGVTLGAEPTGPREVCAGDRVEFLLRPSTSTTWAAPAIRWDGAPVDCLTEAVGTAGAGRVVCVVGEHLDVAPGARHQLELRQGERVVGSVELVAPR